MYSESDFVRIAKRENNKKRNYLVVNPLQGKHIPVSPRKAMGVFSELAGLLEEYRNERLLVVGFAETATAIGAQVAMELGADYIQTTREEVPGAEYLFFSEEHSHATEQRLVRDDLDEAMKEKDGIIFAEDEITTGNTIRNLVDVLKKRYGGKIRFTAVSLLNGMTREERGIFEARGIEFRYLAGISHDQYPELAERAVDDGIYHREDVSEAEYTACFELEGRMDTRRLTDMGRYRAACVKLAEEIREMLPQEMGKRLLVLGTEEFMFPGLYAGKCLEEEGYTVKFHATTRSPMAVSGCVGYPVHERYSLCGMYEEDRKIYVYDIGSYDAVIVMTDAQESGRGGRKGEYSLLNAVRKKNEIVYLVRWCGK